MSTKKQDNTILFTVSYDAKDDEYAQHRMDIDQIIDIFTNMKELIARTDSTLHKRQSTVKIYLQAPVQAGSLEIPFLLENAENAKEILSYLGFAGVTAATSFVGKGVMDVLKKTKGKSILEVQTSNKSPEAKLILDGEELIVDKKIAKLVSNSKLRENIQQVISAPLEGKAQPTFKVKLLEPLTEPEEGVVSFSEESTSPVEETTLELNKTQVKLIENMELSPVSEVHIEEKSTTIALTQISFTGSEKGWKMTYGNKNDVSVELLDQHFIQQINKNIASFRKGDLFNVILQIETRTTGKREFTKYRITKVKNHMASSDRKIISDLPIEKDDE